MCVYTFYAWITFYRYQSIHLSLTYETFRAVYLRRRTSSVTNAIRRSPLFVAFPRRSHAGSKGSITPVSHRSRRSIRLFPIGIPSTFPAAKIGPSSLSYMSFSAREQKRSSRSLPFTVLPPPGIHS